MLFNNNRSSLFQEFNAITFITIIAFVIIQTASKLTFIRTNRPTIGGLPANVFSFDSIQTNNYAFIMVDTSNTTFSVIFVQITANDTYFAYSVSSSSINGYGNQFTHLKVTEGNMIGGQGIFLLFQAKNLTKYSNFFTSSSRILTLNVSTINIV